MLQLLTQNQFLVNKKKCLFGRTSVDYLGHVIFGSKVSKNPTKVQCTKEWPLTRNVQEVRGFLGLIGFYRKFIKNYGQNSQASY